MAVSVVVTDSQVHIRCTGWDRIWSLSRGRTIELFEILSANVLPRSVVRSRLTWRIGGTHFPGLIVAGHFLLRDDAQRPRARAWVLLHRDREALVLELRGRTPQLIALSHPDRHNLAWWLAERI
jgi:hypothetical protein